MIWFFYNILFAAVFVLLLPHYLMRMRRRGGYSAHFWQRLGRYEPHVVEHLQAGQHTWVHAVSVGEAFIALRMIEELRSRNPERLFVLTVTTSTAHAIAEKAISDRDLLLYFPVDFPPIVRRVLRFINPDAILLMECELWPNLIRHAERRGIPVSVINGRISESSYRGYRKLRFLTRRLLTRMHAFCVQSDTDRSRLLELGAPPDAVHVLGSAKYDVAVREEGEDEAREVLRAAGIADNDLVLLGGSTWEGEEAVLLKTFDVLRRKHKQLVLVLVPRHMERGAGVVEQIEAHGFQAVRRSGLDLAKPRQDLQTPFVLLVDTTGELRRLYACADIIFVGKSLTQHGGQNILEPAVYGKPVIVGPNMENFPVVMDDFRAGNAVIQVANADALTDQVEQLIAKPELRRELGTRAAQVIQDKRGVLKRTADILA